jgi:type II secretory pathway pseudopilin PulG
MPRNGVPTNRMALARYAFTILELVAILAIIAILAVLAVPNFGRIIAAAQEALCASKMRSIRLAIDSYLQDNSQIWPQGPRADQPGWAPFWLDTLRPYGITESTWQCPAIRQMTRDQKLPPSLPVLHYVPTMFDATRGIAYRWPTQPWLIEAANAHGKGALICFPDGSVKPMDKVLAEQGIR